LGLGFGLPKLAGALRLPIVYFVSVLD